MSYSRNVISIIGKIPNNTLPQISPTEDPESIVLYYRMDGNLYLYDLKNKKEYDLFNMPILDNDLSCIINPFSTT